MSDTTKTILNPTVPEVSSNHVATVRAAHQRHSQEIAALIARKGTECARADQELKVATAAAESIYAEAVQAALSAKDQSSRKPQKVLRISFLFALLSGILAILALALGLESALVTIAIVTSSVTWGALILYGSLGLRQARRQHAAATKTASAEKERMLASAHGAWTTAKQQAEEKLTQDKATADARKTAAVTGALQALDAQQASKKLRSNTPAAAGPSAKTVLAETLALPGTANEPK